MFEMYLAGMSTIEIAHKFNTPPKKVAYQKVKGEKIPIKWSCFNHFKKLKQYRLCWS